MAEIDDIRKRAQRRYSQFVQPTEVAAAFQDRVFLLNLLDTMASDHLAEIRQMERDFRDHMGVSYGDTRGGGA